MIVRVNQGGIQIYVETPSFFVSTSTKSPIPSEGDLNLYISGGMVNLRMKRPEAQMLAKFLNEMLAEGNP